MGMYEVKQNKEKVSRKIITQKRRNNLIQKRDINIDNERLNSLFNIPIHKVAQVAKRLRHLKKGDKITPEKINNALKACQIASLNINDAEVGDCINFFQNRNCSLAREGDGSKIYEDFIGETQGDEGTCAGQLRSLSLYQNFYRSMCEQEYQRTISSKQLQRSISSLWALKWIAGGENETNVDHGHKVKIEFNCKLEDWLIGKNINIGENNVSNCCYVKTNEPRCIGIGADYLESFNSNISNIRGY